MLVMASRIPSCRRRLLLLTAACMLLCTTISSPVMARALTGEGDTDTVVVASSSSADVTDPPAAEGAEIGPDAAVVKADAVAPATVNEICGKGACPQPSVYPSFTCTENSRFLSAANYSNFACLANVWEDCAVGGPNAWDENNYCGACFLYMRNCYKKPPQTFVMTSATLQDKDNPHVLVLPSDPCTGVDRWEDKNCQRELAWDYADSQVIQKQGSKATPSKFIMAINPVRRRTQQQMHVHVGEMWPSLLTALTQGEQALKNKTSGRFRIKCTKTVDDCKLTNDTSNVIFVRVVRGNNNPRPPSAAEPFSSAYGPNKSPKLDALVNQAAAVVRLSTDDFALLTSSFAAECYFKLDKAKGTPTDLFQKDKKTPKC